MARGEQWRRCPSRPGVEASSLGRVRIGGRVLPIQAPNAAGYLRVAIAGRRAYLHHIVTEAWHGKRPPGKLALHRDDKKTNNTPENLRWGTQADNGLDCSRNGNGRHQRLEPTQVLQIRSSTATRHQLAVAYGVSTSAIHLIQTRQRWKWL